jgi:hypothetical protein
MGQILSLPHRRKTCGCPKKPTTLAGFEPANSGTRGQHANHWTTEAVSTGFTETKYPLVSNFNYPETLGVIINTGRFIIYSGITQIYYRKTVGQVSTKPVKIEGNKKNSLRNLIFIRPVGRHRLRWMAQVEEDLKRMKIVGWKAKVEDRQ